MLVSELEKKLEAMLEEDSPIKIEHGGVIKKGMNNELDEWRSIAEGGQKWIISYQEKLIKETDIPTIKIKYNKVFGYFIEVSAGKKDSVPSFFIRKQTLTNVERFTTEELISYQEKVIRAEEEIIKLETQIFLELCEDSLSAAKEIQDLAEEIADIDLYSSFAELAVENKYTKPEITENNVLEISEGRHPVVEKVVPDFIPNDTTFDNNSRFILLSGPNMSGKSTYLRQNAIIVYLAHIGSFVPAKRASIGLTDKIFTRVGAGDNLTAGESTFMMEMLEASTILHNATERSFIILDELGRGTSTYDGLSLAWAITEYLHEVIGAKTIFATHYHELIEAIEKLKKAKNFSVAVLENESQGVVFLHKIVEGGTDKSYGIEVAKLAGIPKQVLSRARTILHELESKRAKQGDNLQMNLFSSPPKTNIESSEQIIKESKTEKKLRDLTIERLTPLQALNMLEELKRDLD